MKSLRLHAWAAALILLTYALVAFVWIRHELLFVTLLFITASAGLLGVLYGSAADSSGGLPESEPQDPSLSDKGKSSTPPGAFMCGAAALLCAWWGTRACLQEHWGQAAIAIVAGAAAWRLRLPMRLPRLSPGLSALLLLAAIFTGGAFRFYKAGDIPVGLCAIDEQKLADKARSYLGGQRETFASGVVTGALPYYLEALGMKFFGNDLKGFRLSGIILGTLIVFIIYHIARDTAGEWAGLAAAFLWAFSVWPVTISRAHYIIIETDLVDLLTVFLLIKAVKRRDSFLFAFAGLAWSACFNVYTAGQIMFVLLPLLLFLVWYSRPSWRGAVCRGVPPLLAGFAVGMAPLLLWLWTDWPVSMQAYAAPLSEPVMIGNLTQNGPWARLMARSYALVDQFPDVLRMIIHQGTANPWYFPRAFPLVHPAVFFFFVAGLSMCLARFRNALLSFLPYWWFIGLVPVLLSGGAPVDARRAMVSLAPMLLISGLGMAATLDLAGTLIPGSIRKGALLVLGAGFLAWLGAASWHDYFERNQKTYDLLVWTQANAVSGLRAIHDENVKGSVVVVTTRRPTYDSWVNPGLNPWRGEEFGAVNPGVPWIISGDSLAYYKNKGMFGALQWALDEGQSLKQQGKGDSDVLVALDPFYFYLEPLLQRLGGKTVRELPLIRSNEGALLGDVGMAPTEDHILKLVRLHNLRKQDMDALQGRLFRMKLGELNPPRQFRHSATGLQPGSPQYVRMASNYEEHPENWSVSRTADFDLPDPWFWGPMNQGLNPPLRLHSRFIVNIPEDGLYAFGASATPITQLRIDRKRVFLHDPNDPTNPPYVPDPLGRDMKSLLDTPDFLGNRQERSGYLGKPVLLKAGAHRLDLDQLLLTPVSNYVLRLIWCRPGGKTETLPLEVLDPAQGGAL